MEKQPSEMTLEELWTLFPIVLKEYQPAYKAWFQTEVQNIKSILPQEEIVRVSHIGSTAVEGLLSKPTVDILLEIDGRANTARLIEALASAGYTPMATADNPFKVSLAKGYTPQGFAEKVFHLHIVYFGDWDELYFRDYLIGHPETANAYGVLKKELSEKYKNDRDAYTAAKEEFIRKHSSIAKRDYKNKYKAGGTSHG